MSAAETALRSAREAPGNQGGCYAMKLHGRSFHWASRFFRPEQAQAVARLYAFCRYVDDLADQPDVLRARATLAQVTDELVGEVSSTPVVADFLRLAIETDIDRTLPHLLLHSLRQDIGAVRMEDWQHLLRYSYGVASTVGLMMCAVLGVRDPRAKAFAVDLGVAMQLTNIARDVLEDAERNRVYLPLTTCPSVTAAALVGGDETARRSAYRAVNDVLDCASIYYRSADQGMCYLPLRARIAVLSASRLYEAIGAEIRREPARFWQRRAVVGKVAKAQLTTRALAELVSDPTYWGTASARRHHCTLHIALAGLPGADA